MSDRSPVTNGTRDGILTRPAGWMRRLWTTRPKSWSGSAECSSDIAESWALT
jgi:hypothetical protein